MNDDRPEDQRPSTRRMEPIDPSAGAYPGGDAYPQGDYAEGSGSPAYSNEGYGNKGYGNEGYGDPSGQPPGPPKNSGRTVVLSLIIVLALVLLGIAGYLVYRGMDSTGDSENAGAAGSSSSVATAPSSSEAPSSAEAPSSSAAPADAGPVTYRFTGNGNLLAVNYRGASGNTVLATAGAPWSVQATLAPGATAELTGIVVQGRVTCTITQGDTVLATSTSSGGPISCRAALPRD
ncbi:hypothetical protein GOHSU_47_00220 [Gordonia hirsuta DSM 44140 = NBRC 16056]|uniref:Uncharacterized protein n=1 Tax=Gordonia hirsuta DSM 44140 = NBRC 16056 TaxID=1121927 RepID=L7LDA0_9ACTN|nr:hypothetical protein [Gordonia hirsuta]GAC58736.1 hypothetical protein GOHSU_47_00220 [Gordonia hirsuta DSM 44140 = NBRC 16056]